MITEDYVSFETAKLLKEKGFDEECPCSYRKKLVGNKIVDEEELFVSAHLMLTNSELEDKTYRDIVYCSAPTLQMAMKWLREVHGIHINIDCVGAKNYIPTIQFTYFGEDIIVESNTSKIGGNGFDSNEEACEAAIKYCLENLIDP